MANSRISPELDRRLRRLERVSAAVFTQFYGDRGMPDGSSRYPCPDCGATGRLSDGFQCVRCVGVGTISMKAQATLDVYAIHKEHEQPELETREAA